MSVEPDDLEELAGEIRRLIASNKAFLERVNDEEYDAEEGEEGDEEATSEEGEYEEL